MFQCAQVDQPHLLLVHLIPKSHPQVWHIRLLDVIALRPWLPVRCAKPVLLALVGEAGVQHAIARQLAAVRGCELPHLHSKLAIAIVQAQPVSAAHAHVSCLHVHGRTNAYGNTQSPSVTSCRPLALA